MIAAMTLLDDVIGGASGETSVATLLRQLTVISSRVGSVPLAAWVDHELRGYDDVADLPEYRGPFNLLPLGHFVGPFNSEVRNVQIPPMTFPENMRDSTLFKIWLMQPVAEIEEMARAESTTITWPPDALPMYNALVSRGDIRRIVQPDMVLADVRCPVARGTFVGALDGVRTRILDLALEIEQVAPSAGQAETSSVERQAAAHVINNFFGSGANVAIGGVGTTQISIGLPASGDADALLRYLAAAGVPLDRLADLETALNADAGDEGKPSRWVRTRAWFASAASDVGTNSLGGIIATAAAAFFG